MLAQIKLHFPAMITWHSTSIILFARKQIWELNGKRRLPNPKILFFYVAPGIGIVCAVLLQLINIYIFEKNSLCVCVCGTVTQRSERDDPRGSEREKRPKRALLSVRHYDIRSPRVVVKATQVLRLKNIKQNTNPSRKITLRRNVLSRPKMYSFRCYDTSRVNMLFSLHIDGTRRPNNCTRERERDLPARVSHTHTIYCSLRNEILNRAASAWRA